MSNRLITMTYKRDLRSPMRKAVMALFADKASDDGSGVYASKQTMADELCCSKQAVLDTIKAFITEGLLVELGKRRVAQGFTVEYGIVVDALDALPLVKCHADRAKRGSSSLTGQPVGPVNEDDRSSAATPPVQHVDPNPPETTPSKATPSSGKRPTRLPDGFTPVMSGKTAAVVAGWPPGRLDDERDAFADHHRAKGTLSHDWQASWRTWVAKSKKWERPSGQRSDNRRGQRTGFRDPLLQRIADGDHSVLG